MDVDSDCLPAAPKFSCGPDLGTLAVASGLAHVSWLKISQLEKTVGSDNSSSSVSVEFEQFEEDKFYVVAFTTSLTAEFLQENGGSICSQNTVDFEFLSSKGNPDISIRTAAASLVSSANIPDFQFLCSKQTQHFSLNAAAISLFLSVRDRLSDLKDQIVTAAKSKPFIITGHGLGGSLATLFTVWLLDSLDTVATKRPLCITFGSPPVGNRDFQKAVSQYSTWNSCFLNVVHRDDPFPTLFNQQVHNLKLKVKEALPLLHTPFGTYLFCSDSGSTCFESSGSVAELLDKMRLKNNGNGVWSGFDYGSTVDGLRGKVLCRDNANPNGSRNDDSFILGIKAQLAAIGFQQKKIEKISEPEIEDIIDKIEAIDSTKKLNEVKMMVAQLGWYKKVTARADIGYYDSYKKLLATRDHDVVGLKKHLDIYWKKTIEEAENKPQKVAAHLRKRWLYSGTLYRRMVEPLHIADFYKVEGNRNYLQQGRPKHLSKLEELHGLERKKASDGAEKRHTMLGSQLTEDSCFWAHVEEAILSSKSLRTGGNTEQDKKALKQFEEYAYDLINNYGVSPEIFVKESTFMKWWEDYEKILKDGLMGEKQKSKLVRFMSEPKNRKDKDGMYTPLDDDDDDDDDDME